LVTDAGFFPIASFAVSIASASPRDARKLLLQAARHYPSLALRELDSYSDLPFGRDIFEQAARTAPDEAVGSRAAARLPLREFSKNFARARGPRFNF